MDDYIENGGQSRGSALYSTRQGSLPDEKLPEIFRFVLDDGSRGHLIQEVRLRDEECIFTWRKVREIPEIDDFFENVWRSYREHGNVF